MAFIVLIAVCAGLAAVIVILNLVTLRRLWASPLFEKSQKLIQSVLLWLIPGSVFLVRHVLSEKPGKQKDDAVDPTSTNTNQRYADSSLIDFSGPRHD